MSLPPFPFDNSYARLPEHFHRSAQPAQAPDPELIRFNSPLAEELGIDVNESDEHELAAVFSGNSLPENAEPIALAYAGHQFGNFVPQLGDGRAVLIGEVIDQHQKRRDIQLKGAGRTEFSRGGDGRAPIGPVIREYIISEAMHTLGIPTTRALAAVTTGNAVMRERPEPGAVLTRVAASHIRVGTFEYFAYRQDTDAIRTLADYAISRHYPSLMFEDQPYQAFFRAVAHRQAELIADWMSIGFIHGVMNTDNMAISGETIDYGPCAFMDQYHANTVFSSIDAMGRYAYSNQPEIGYWNLARLAECLLPLFDGDKEETVETAKAILTEYREHYSTTWRERFGRKLGISSLTQENEPVVHELLGLMQQTGNDFTACFRELTRLASQGRAKEAATTLFADTQQARDWNARWVALLDAPEVMWQTNPAIIPRNHQVEAAVSAAQQGDLRHFHDLMAALESPFSATADTSAYRHPPTPQEQVARTFCGT
ncbi:protein adenylyltransferase SelO [Vreelandella utahensis]|uniref:protein adenylyltransferase SelO n=1 Tax=Vreelandella halophila TaxID=86177 RepID=UPI000986262F|nr:YdiU family protein [Halomonas utahensis]